jgi:hypothetical protein
MEQAAMTTENLRNVMTTVDAMKSANKDMRRQYAKVDINKIERLLHRRGSVTNGVDYRVRVSI